MQALAQPSSAGIYTCIDASGRRITADRPIPQCADREQSVYGRTGVELKRIGPALSEVEMAERLEQRRLEQQQAYRAREQRRRDAALLVRYPDRAAHESERRQSLAQVNELQIITHKRLMELEKAHFELSQELEFYAKDPSKAPGKLRAALEDSERNVQEQKRYIEAQEADKRRIHLRFNEELERLQSLWDSQKNQQP